MSVNDFWNILNDLNDLKLFLIVFYPLTWLGLLLRLRGDKLGGYSGTMHSSGGDANKVVVVVWVSLFELVHYNSPEQIRKNK